MKSTKSVIIMTFVDPVQRTLVLRVCSGIYCLSSKVRPSTRNMEMLLPIIYYLSHRELSTILSHQTYWPNCKADCLFVYNYKVLQKMTCIGFLRSLLQTSFVSKLS